MNNLIAYCNRKNDEKLITYKQLKTEGNDPTMTKAMKIANYARNSKCKSYIKTNNNVNAGY
jgi:hypothetical protein